jgi:hypothetical protein
MTRGRFDRNEVLGRTDLRVLLDELCGASVGHGHQARWRCPVSDHDDIHPSVTVTVDRRGIERWRCWSGPHGGTAIDAMYAVFGHLSYRDALAELALRAGVQRDEPGVNRIRPPLPPRAPVPLDPAVVRYVERCERLLWEPVGRPVLDHLLARGLDEEVLKLNRVGADPGPRGLRRSAGLPKAGPGAVFPALGSDGTVLYVQTRYLEPGANQSKYGNPVSRLGDNPRHGWTRTPSVQHEVVIVCEGFPDAYTANAAGHIAVAVLGATNATPALAERIAPGLVGRPAIVAFDGDDVGRKASRTLTEALHGRGIMVVEIPLPSGMDLNSWVAAARKVPELGPITRPWTTIAPTAPALPQLPGP